MEIILSIVLAFIAFQQWRTSEKSRRDKFLERRWKFFDELKQVTWNILEGVSFEENGKKNYMEKHNKLILLREESRFLFNNKVYDVIKELVKSSSFVATYDRSEEASHKEKVGNIQIAVAEYFDKNKLEELFSPYLKIEKPWDEDIIDCLGSLKTGIINIISKFRGESPT